MQSGRMSACLALYLQYIRNGNTAALLSRLNCRPAIGYPRPASFMLVVSENRKLTLPHFVYQAPLLSSWAFGGSMPIKPRQATHGQVCDRHSKWTGEEVARARRIQPSTIWEMPREFQLP